MNKLMLGLVAAAALAVGTTQGASARPTQTPAEEIAELQRQLARLQGEVNLLKQNVATASEAEAEVQQVVAYLRAQAQAAAGLQRVLAESEAKGFTFGINPESREVLLAGFDAFAETLQTDLPGAEPETE